VSDLLATRPTLAPAPFPLPAETIPPWSSACFFIAGFASTWGPGIWVVTGEMYPTRGRQKMQALSVSSNWIWNFLLAVRATWIESSGSSVADLAFYLLCMPTVLHALYH
jgi:hypothetical protein